MDTNVSYWIFEKYFMKCHYCGYELPIGQNIFAPRNCPHCNSLMREQHGPLYKFLERNKEYDKGRIS